MRSEVNVLFRIVAQFEWAKSVIFEKTVEFKVDITITYRGINR